MSTRTDLLKLAHEDPSLRPHLVPILRRAAQEKWIPKDLEKGRCTPGSPNYDCPPGSPQYNLAQTFKKHPEWGAKGRKTQEKRARLNPRDRKKMEKAIWKSAWPDMRSKWRDPGGPKVVMQPSFSPSGGSELVTLSTLSDRDLQRWYDGLVQIGSIKTAAVSRSLKDMKDGLAMDKKSLKRAEDNLQTLKDGGTVAHLTLAGAKKNVAALKAVIKIREENIRKME